MRQQLAKQDSIRLSFVGEFQRFGVKTNYHGYSEKTVLLVNIKNTQHETVCDHLWFNFTKQFQTLGEIQPGQQISFDARVKKYVKGYINYREFIDNSSVDYKLSHPTKVKFVI